MMLNYIYTETDSPVRGSNKQITVWRIKQNKPELVGSSDHTTASWKGARPSACDIIHNVDRIHYATNHDGSIDGYSLQGMLGFADLYDTTSGPGIRLFAV